MADSLLFLLGNLDLQDSIVFPIFQFNKDIEITKIPGTVYVGDIINAYRSEHYLADAQATNDQGVTKKI